MSNDQSPYPPPGGAIDQVTISGWAEPRTVPLPKETITLGRSKVNDIILEEDSVSSKHARLQRTAGAWQVTDLDSTNGTMIAGQTLRAREAKVWHPGQTLAIGPYNLTLQTAVKPVRPAPNETESSDRPSNLANIRLDPLARTMAPGAEGDVTLSATNESAHVEKFIIELQGLPDDWVIHGQRHVELMPGLNPTSFRLSIKIPPTGVMAKTYRYRVVVRSEADSREEGVVFGNIIVTPTPNFVVEIHPPTVKRRGNCEVRINNKGNRDDHYSALVKDRQDAIQFDKMAEKVTVPAGEERRLALKIKPLARPLVGGAGESATFDVDVFAADGAKQTGTANLLIKPWISRRWLAILALFITIPVFVYPTMTIPRALSYGRNLATATAASLTATVDNATVVASATSSARETETMVAIGAATADAANTATAVAATATAFSLLNATAQAEASATSAAAATATWEATDGDGDGLTNGEELSLGTDPTLADTDNDGLLDGQEIDRNGVPLLGTNPKNPDTDGDNCTDGEEIRNGTDPDNPDTDNDGVPDCLDSQPLITPTPLPPPRINTLPNPSFEQSAEPFAERSGAFVKQELQVPAGWQMLVDDNVPNPSGGPDSRFVFPEMLPIRADQMNECRDGRFEEICNIFAGAQAMKVFKGGLPIRFALFSQEFLQPGVYTFRIHFFADAVAGYNGEQKIWASAGAAELQLCIDGAEYDHRDWETVEIGSVRQRELEFIVPIARDVTIYAKFRNTQPLVNNGWFLDDWVLEPSGVLNDDMKGQLSDDHGCLADLTQAYSN